ncbi:MAG: flagellar basal body L-ring protein FlgH [Proteobacteria bacterium]|nr:flagellar basal body L-ring protein FlgH [Pseudomonadota bacterium]HQR04998.1 flagellar basal body L-ring protein FlgH [Rhodocyclaceae bacterium]
MRILRIGRLPFLFSLLLTGCVATVPPTAVHQPMSIRPEARMAAGPANGSIYNTGNARPLFEDRRSRFVGDILTINIVENVQASKKSGTSASRTQTVSAGVPAMDGTPFKGVTNLNISANDSNKFTGAGENSSTAVFTSTITVTVIEVLPNGNLLVSGEKQIGLKEGEEFVRFSGVVNPTTITSANTVQSTQVADARIEYKANGFLDESQRMGWLSRFFLSVLPF